MDIRKEIEGARGYLEIHCKDSKIADSNHRILDIIAEMDLQHRILKEQFEVTVPRIEKVESQQFFRGNLIKQLQACLANSDVEFKHQAELSPCPFYMCGSDNVTVCGDADGYHVQCHECQTKSPSRPTEFGAREAWNKRTY